ncbi:MAG: N-acetylneuraminate synthase family protein [Ignavibacteria bacterium]|nr:N-acetylneuraminate synthase family protein [Ignavibacteria bacterium]
MENPKPEVKIGDRYIGEGHPVYIIAEIGINHNGSMEVAKKMIDGAVFAGADAVKFQKRTPEICVPADQWLIERETPWGRMTYIDYKRKTEFTMKQYFEIDQYCRQKGIDWFTSCWDIPSVEFIEQFDTPVYKIASACITDMELLAKIKETGKPVMISTGMSTMREIEEAVKILGSKNTMIAHSTSAYPCKPKELNLNMINTLKRIYPEIPIGYSGHETGLATTYAAAALGACFIERHITLDRAMWGTDQAASVEIMGLYRLVHNIRDIERSLGDGVKKVYESELNSLNKLRKIKTEKVEIAA